MKIKKIVNRKKYNRKNNIKNSKQNNKKRIRIKKIVKGFLFILLLLFLIFGFDIRLKVVTYTINAENLKQPIQIAFVADLHSCNYGENQEKLIEAIDKQNPDLILLGGDIFDDDLPQDKAWELIEGIVMKYPCYYVTGNHEWRTKDVVNIKNKLRDYGVFVLEGDVLTFEKNGESIKICGVDDPNAGEEKFITQLESCNEQITKDDVSILLTHRPELIETYLKYDFDYVMAGHAHGGQWRIPGIINGLFVPAQGFLPKYTGGVYEFPNAMMILSRGLSRESSLIPRFYNRPELVIVDLE
jgi:predicted MPP superfamily phosphohydrolase